MVLHHSAALSQNTMHGYLWWIWNTWRTVIPNIYNCLHLGQWTLIKRGDADSQMFQQVMGSHAMFSCNSISSSWSPQTLEPLKSQDADEKSIVIKTFNVRSLTCSQTFLCSKTKERNHRSYLAQCFTALPQMEVAVFLAGVYACIPQQFLASWIILFLFMATPAFNVYTINTCLWSTEKTTLDALKSFTFCIPGATWSPRVELKASWKRQVDWLFHQTDISTTD